MYWFWQRISNEFTSSQWLLNKLVPLSPHQDKIRSTPLVSTRRRARAERKWNLSNPYKNAQRYRVKFENILKNNSKMFAHTRTYLNIVSCPTVFCGSFFVVCRERVSIDISAGRNSLSARCFTPTYSTGSGRTRKIKVTIVWRDIVRSPWPTPLVQQSLGRTERAYTKNRRVHFIGCAIKPNRCVR